jgi:Lipocalin-like domain
MGSYIGYYGNFAVDFEAQEVVHTPIVAHERRLVGRPLHRKYQFYADRLALTTSSVDARIGVIESRLVWCRRTVK